MSIWTQELEDAIDFSFIERVQAEVTQSCALPFSVPTDRIPEYIIQAAQWFWANVDQSVEDRHYVIRNEDICKGINRIIQLPPQIMSLYGCHKLKQSMYGTMGDFSIERMMMSSWGAMGGGGLTGNHFQANGGLGYNLSDMVISLYEIDTFSQVFNTPLTYNFNEYSSKLVILGNLGNSDVLIQALVRCRIQDLYNSYYFFRLCVCLLKRALATIYGTYEFKLPGGVTINYSNFTDQADAEMEEIKEWAERNRANDYFMMSGSI